MNQSTTQAKPRLVFVLDNIRSGHNVGAAFRIADAFAIERIYLCGMTPTPPHREIRKTALGAEETVPWQYTATTEQALTSLHEEGYQCLAVEQTNASVPLDRFVADTSKPLAFIFGHEVWGVSPQALEQADACLVIPQYGKKKSLNVATCIAITAWEWTRGR